MSSRNKLLNNFMSLAFLQGVNYILPLVTLPYLVRVLGPSNYGIIAFAQSFVLFFVMFTDYGFNLTATRQISIKLQEKSDVKDIFNSVLNSKLILLIIAFFIYCLLIVIVPRFKEEFLIFFLSFGMVIGSVLFPLWFFQGIEKMKFVSIINIASKLLFTITIFLFIKKPSDIIFVPIFNSLGYIFAGVLALAIVRYKFNVRYSFSTFKEIKEQLIEGWEVFLSTLAISLYTVSNTFILGLFTNNTIVGYYASAEKVVNAATGIITPVSQTIYPHVNGLIVKSKEAGISFINKILKIISLGTLIMTLVLLLFAEDLVILLLGNQYVESISIIKILAPLPILIGLSNIFGVQTMLSLGYKKVFSRILISGSVLNVLVALILVPRFHHVGTAIGVVVTETIITLIMAGFLWKKRILLRRYENV